MNIVETAWVIRMRLELHELLCNPNCDLTNVSELAEKIDN